MQSKKVNAGSRLRQWLAAPLLVLASLSAADAHAAGAPSRVFEIKGTVPAENSGDKVSVTNFDGDEIAAGKVAAGGHFTISGTTAAVQRGLVHVGKRIKADIVLEPGQHYEAHMAITGLLVRGGQYHNQVFGYLVDPEVVKAVTALKAWQDKAYADINTKPEAEQNKIREENGTRNRVIFKLKDDYQDAILQGDYPTLLKLLVLSDSEDSVRYPDQRRLELLDQYQKELGPIPMIVQLREGYTSRANTEQIQAGLTPGNRYKDVTIKDKSGKSVELSQVLASHKLVLLDYWASWCSPCRAEFPHLRKVYERYHDKGFEIYSISLDTNPGALAKALEEEKLPWQTYSDLKGHDSPPALAYGVNGLPSNFLIAANGTIVGAHLRGEELEKAVSEQLPN